jgi:hypothetical protein
VPVSAFLASFKIRVSYSSLLEHELDMKKLVIEVKDGL